ncbi:MAG TPA: alpha/beta hydrolase-fold protein, partial [Chitinophagaceae bacterium]|nr:alpha/beta hydrolase-fold protein [Chitinophagaceae bacterium]
MKRLLLPVVLSMSAYLQAQHTVKIRLQPLSGKLATETVYIAGSFNGWNPRDETFRLKKNADSSFELLLNNIPEGDYEFKFTKGGWETVETDVNGQSVGNRQLRLSSDTVLNISIAGWASGTSAPPKHTASRNVRIMDSAFYMPQLKRYRRIWVYLPPGYFIGNKRYPVLYMHDGQNLFDDATAFSGEWGIDETLDSMKKHCIVVGIDNGGLKRMNEYNPYDNDRFGKGEGKQYLAFIVKTLKPFIDKKYKTLADKKNTHIAGSSMGGLISMYAAIVYPNVFGSAGVFSPSFWISPKLKDDISKRVRPSTHR